MKQTNYKRMRAVYIIAALIILIILIIIVFIATAKLSKKSESITLTMAELFSEDTSIAQADIKFAELVNERTDGRISIDIKFNGELGSEAETVNMLKDKSIAMTRISTTGLVNDSNVSKIFQIPFLFENREELHNNLNSSLGEDIGTELKKSGITPLCYFYNGDRNFCFTSRVETTDSFKGKRIRVNKAEINSSFLNSLNANPVPLDPTEVSEAFEAKTIDGAEIDPVILKGTNISDYAKYILILDYKSIPACLVINNDIFSDLSEEEQEIIKSCAKEAEEYQWKNWDSIKENFDLSIKKRGCIYVKPNEDEIEKFKDKAKNILDDDSKALLDKYDLKL